jgi:branched-chain amino acid aminotransferase
MHYGQAVFEGMKARRTDDDEIVLFRPLDNGKRMAEGCARLMMAQFDPEKFVQAVEETVRANKAYIPPTDSGGALYIRPFLIGSGPVLGVSPADQYTFMVFTAPVGPYFRGGFNPIRLEVQYHYHRAVNGGVGSSKAAGNYAAGMLPAKKAKEDGYAEILYLDGANHHYEEVGAANFFLLKGKELATPELGDESILPGITRDSVLQLAKDEGLETSERDILVDEIFEADEAFCTGTAAVITPIGEVTVFGKKHVISEEAGVLSRLFYDKLNAIQLKREPDKYGWVETIGEI